MFDIIAFQRSEILSLNHDSNVNWEENVSVNY